MQMFGIVFGTKREHMVFNASKLNSSMLQSTGAAVYSSPKSSMNYLPPDLHLYEIGWTYAWFNQVCIVKFHQGSPDAYKWWITRKIYGKVLLSGIRCLSIPVLVLKWLMCNLRLAIHTRTTVSSCIISKFFSFFIQSQLNHFKIVSFKCTSNYLQKYPKLYAARYRSLKEPPKLGLLYHITSTKAAQHHTMHQGTRTAPSGSTAALWPSAGETFLPQALLNPCAWDGVCYCIPVITFWWHHHAAGFISSPTKLEKFFIL